MENSAVAKAILAKVLNVESINSYVMSNDIYGDKFLVIPGNGNARWIVPSNSKLACGVLAQWKPYGIISLFKWGILRLLYRLDLLKIVPGVVEVNFQKEKNMVASGKTCVVPVIYVGTPGPQQKAVVTLVEFDTGAAVSIMKVPLSEGAIASIKAEALALESLQKSNFDKAPQLTEFDEARGISLQTVLPGKLAGGKFNADMLDCLLNMPNAGLVTTVDEQRAQLEIAFNNSESLFQSHQQALIKKGLVNIQGNDDIKLLFTHGDFAPWNIKQGKGGCSFFDLEDALHEGLPLWDICHFHFIQACLFGKTNLIEDMLSNKFVTLYMQAASLTMIVGKQLMLLYMLRTVLSIGQNNASAEYKVFLISKIQTVLDI